MKLKKSVSSVLALTLVIGGIMASSNRTVYADSSHSTVEQSIQTRGSAKGDITPIVGEGSVSGVTFYTNAEVYSNTSGYGYGQAVITSSKPVTAGKMGVSASLFDGNSVLLESTPYYYNTTTSTYMSHKTASRIGYPRFIGGGAGRCTTASSTYKTVSLSRTKSITAVSREMLEHSNLSVEELNERKFMLEEKYMIAAEATNGKIGYVLINDLEEDKTKSVEEALDIQSKRGADYSKSINVYDTDNNIIGEFIIKSGEIVEE